jgi:hypothetical protein
MKLIFGVTNVTGGPLVEAGRELPAAVTDRGPGGTLGKLKDGVCVPLR